MYDPMDANVTPEAKVGQTAGEPEVQTPDLGALIIRVAHGQQAALHELYDLTVAKLFGLARLILRDGADAEEAVCDTYEQIWETADRFEIGRGTALGWMLMICRSRSLDLLRHRRSRTRTAESYERDLQAGGNTVSDPDALLLSLQQGSSVHGAMSKLSPIRQRLVALAFLQGLSHQEIAEEMGMPLGTVKSHIRRALTVLRQELRLWDDHEAAC